MRFLSLLILILAALASATVSRAVEFPDAPTRMPGDPADLAGSYLAPDHSGFSGWEYFGGSMIFEYIGIADYRDVDGNTIILVTWMLPSGDGPATWLVTDAVEIGPVPEGDRIYMLCRTRETNITVSAFAIGVDNWEDTEVTDFDQAWIVNSRDGTISDVDVSAIVCTNDVM